MSHPPWADHEGGVKVAEVGDVGGGSDVAAGMPVGAEESAALL
jgi:hypothetical protein